MTQVDNGTATQRQSYAYDALSNRVQKQLGNPVTSTIAYKLDAANQLIEVHQTNLTGALLEATLYDNAGNQSQKCSGATVTRASNTACTGSVVSQTGWNSFNKLAQITGATTANYQYDDQGRRTQKTEAATTTNYLYDGQSIYGEYPNADWTTPNALYVQAGTDHPLARITGSVASPSANAAYYHQDGLGSVLATTNATKVVTATQRFDAYGQKLAGAGTVPQYGYTGREPDQSGLNYYRARYYDPNGGRFTARDPMGYADGINRYAYVGNNPVNFNDPNGLVARAAATWVDTQSTSYVSARTELYSNIGNGIGNAYNSGLSQLPSSVSTPIQGFVSGAQGQVSSNPSVANFLGNNLREGFTNILDSVAPTIPGTDIRFAFGLGTKSGVPGNNFVPNNIVTGPYVRPSGAGPTAAQRAAVQGQPCVDCGAITPKQVADHIDPLVVQYYRDGDVNVGQQSSVNAVQAHCPTCSASQGGQLSAFSKTMKQIFGF